MPLSEAEFRRMTGELTSVGDRLEGLAQSLTSAVRTVLDGAGWVLRGVADSVLWALQKIVDLVRYFVGLIRDFAANLMAPVLVCLDAVNWGLIVPKASQVGSDLAESGNRLGPHWRGQAASRFTDAAGRQANAAKRIGSIAGETALALGGAAAAAYTFFVAVCAVVREAVPVLLASWGLISTGVLSMLGLAGVAAGLARVAVLTKAAIDRGRASYQIQGGIAMALQVRILDRDEFPTRTYPNGRRGPGWPQAVREYFSDASTADGTTSLWVAQTIRGDVDDLPPITGSVR
jgi:hypothetical protein